jgi:hypothetical protein
MLMSVLKTLAIKISQKIKNQIKFVICYER